MKLFCAKFLHTITWTCAQMRNTCNWLRVISKFSKTNYIDTLLIRNSAELMIQILQTLFNVINFTKIIKKTPWRIFQQKTKSLSYRKMPLEGGRFKF